MALCYDGRKASRLPSGRAMSEPAHVTSLRAEGPLILVAEDDRDTRELYQQFLRLSGFRTEQAHNGHQALDKAAELHPDLVVTDLALPGIDGFELSDRLRRGQTTSHIPVIAVSGYPFADVEERARKAGIRALLLKPCLPGDLVAEIRRVLGEPKQPRARPA
jgi:CheY-like chemotaxis protein